MTKELQVIKYVLVYSKKYAEEFLNDSVYGAACTSISGQSQQL